MNYTEDTMVSLISCGKAGLARGIQGTESLWLNSRLSVDVVPSRDGALGVIGVSGRASLNENDCGCIRIFYHMCKDESADCIIIS